MTLLAKIKEVVIMGKRLTDIEKKKIIADYVECENYSEAARKNDVSRYAVKKIVRENGDISEKIRIKKEENTKDVLAYMGEKSEYVCGLIDTYLDALQDPYKIEKASVIQIATALGIVIDKFTAVSKDDRALEKLSEVMDKIGGVI